MPCRQKLLQKPIRFLCPLRTNFCCLHMLPLTRVFTPKKKEGCLEGSLSQGLIPCSQRAWCEEQVCSDCTSGIPHTQGCPGVIWLLPSTAWDCGAGQGSGLLQRKEREMKQTFYQEPSRGAEGRIDSSKVFGCRSESSSYIASLCSHSGLAP